MVNHACMIDDVTTNALSFDLLLLLLNFRAELLQDGLLADASLAFLRKKYFGAFHSKTLTRESLYHRQQNTVLLVDLPRNVTKEFPLN